MRYSKLFGLSLVSLLLLSSPASAVSDSAASGTLGGVINSVRDSFSNFPDILSVISYIAGLFFAVVGVFKFKDHVDNPTNNPLSAGVKRFIAGGMMFSAPFMASTLKGTLFGGGGSELASGAHHTAPSGGGMDQMIVNFVSNIYGPTIFLLTAFTYIAALILLLTGVARLTKTAQDGPRGPAGLGTIMTFLAAGALFAFGDMMGSFSSSLFGTSTVATYAQISPTVISDTGDANKISAVIEALMAFIMLVGFIAFIRGWFVLKAFADGSSNASIAQGLTFLFGGALAINLGQLVNVLEKTVGVTGLTFQ
jgi:intracellular multiplication protein IcmC